jgi:putative transposase
VSRISPRSILALTCTVTRPLRWPGRRRGPRISLHHDWGPQYRSAHFLGSISWPGITDDAAFLGEPETNGCAERWIRTLKEQCLWVELHDTIEELRPVVAGFVATYNNQWLIGRLGQRTPKEAYQDAITTAAA